MKLHEVQFDSPIKMADGRPHEVISMRNRPDAAGFALHLTADFRFVIVKHITKALEGRVCMVPISHCKNIIFPEGVAAQELFAAVSEPKKAKAANA